MSKLRLSTLALMVAALTNHANVHGQTPRVQADQGNQQELQNQGNQRNRTPTASSQQPGPTVQEALVQKLIKANEAEIELAQLAKRTSDNEEVKKFAETMIQDHQDFNQTLQQHAGYDTSRQDHSGQDHSGKAASRQSDRSQTAAYRTASDRTQNDRRSENRAIDTRSNRVPRELCEITEQACDNALEMTKSMLSNYQGQDFNMAYLGQQCVAHTMMLAELKAIQSKGPAELQQIAQQASTKVQKHLDQAKQIAKKLEDDSKSRS